MSIPTLTQQNFDMNLVQEEQSRVFSCSDADGNEKGDMVVKTTKPHKNKRLYSFSVLLPYKAEYSSSAKYLLGKRPFFKHFEAFQIHRNNRNRLHNSCIISLNFERFAVFWTYHFPDARCDGFS
jgi:hypothetical protein